MKNIIFYWYKALAYHEMIVVTMDSCIWHYEWKFCIKRKRTSLSGKFPGWRHQTWRHNPTGAWNDTQVCSSSNLRPIDIHGSKLFFYRNICLSEFCSSKCLVWQGPRWVAHQLRHMKKCLKFRLMKWGAYFWFNLEQFWIEYRFFGSNLKPNHHKHI